ncbi:MAG: hypothetical protein M1133_05885 [Armatimonadetes bacterium]|nr:hypothetical protein [Armatimonadota bacterium]
MCKKAILLSMVGCLLSSVVSAAPTVSNVSAPSSAALYDKFEVTFDVSTVATNLYWPYDPSPSCNTAEHPDAAPVGVGVTVDGLFLPPGESDWNGAIVQPAFYFQEFTRGDYLRNPLGADWLYPTGNPCWKIRFAPKQTGTWQYRIRVTDASGTATYTPTPNTFSCASSSNRGFVRVSPTDYRYFETSDGKYLNFAGTESPKYMVGDQLVGTAHSYDQDVAYPIYAANGLNLMRVWWNATEQPCLFGLSGQGGFYNWRDETGNTTGCTISGVAKPGEIFSMKVSGSGAYKSISTSIDVKPSTNYVISAWVKTTGLSGGSAYIIVYDRAGFQAHVPISNSISGDTDWTYLHGSFTTKSDQRVVAFVNVEVANSTATSAVYVTDMSVKEDFGAGQYGPELVWRQSFDPQASVSMREAWRADYQVECARRAGIYLKVILQEKKDKGFCSIGANGRYADYDENNFYCWSDYAGRTFQRYYWRYIIARYGYATSIQSFEVTNEGDPFNGMHYEAVQAMAKYFNDNDPNQHLVTTSLWHSFPSWHLWASTSYPDVKIADWHRNIGLRTGQASQMVYHGWQYELGSRLDNNTYRESAPSMHLSPPAGEAADVFSRCSVHSELYAITPSHTYTLRWWVKGVNLVPKPGTSATPYIAIYTYDGCTNANILTTQLATGGQNLLQGTFDWTLRSAQFTTPSNGWYLVLNVTLDSMKGDCYFDDITLYDETAGEYVDFPNGDFSSERADHDSALMVYALGQQVGTGSARQVKKPVVDANAEIIGDLIYTDPYKGYSFSCEDQRMIDDGDGVWYRKFIWSQVNPFGLVNLYYLNELIMKRELYRYAKAYQAFMADIPLSNGHYADAKALTSVKTLRAWGQKDTVNGRVHLWIDNAKYTWRNVADGVAVAPISGTVTVSGLANGNYRVEWWNTSTGQVALIQDTAVSGGTLTLSVTNLQSDIACKIYPAPAVLRLRMIVPSTDVIPSQVVTVTVEYTNDGESEARNAVVSTHVPALMDYVAGSAEASGGVYDAVTKAVTWTVASVGANQTGSRTFQARVQ